MIAGLAVLKIAFHIAQRASTGKQDTPAQSVTMSRLLSPVTPVDRKERRAELLFRRAAAVRATAQQRDQDLYPALPPLAPARRRAAVVGSWQRGLLRAGGDLALACIAPVDSFHA